MAEHINNKFDPDGDQCCSGPSPCRCRLPWIPGRSPSGELNMSPSLHTPLLSLRDELAPYRGHWHFERRSADRLAAIHTTNHPGHSPECVIETRQLGDRHDASLFARHLLNHGWVLEQLHAGGESLLIRTPSA